MKPIIKWQGGKTQLLPEIKKFIPKEFNTYFEPFLGGGAVLLELQPPVACVNDWNSELINLYRVINDDEKVKKLLSRLDEMQLKIDKLTTKDKKRPYYNRIRDLDRKKSFSSIEDYNRAARFIFLNKLGFNGRYRENKDGFFNIPLGNYDSVTLYNKSDFDYIQEYFSKNLVLFSSGDFSKNLKKAKAGDFVYMDPPYDPIVTSELSYNAAGFSKKDQVRVAREAHELTKRGVKVMVSNHNTQLITKLFEGYEIYTVLARRSISCNPDTRGPVEEVIIRNYDDNGNVLEINEFNILDIDENKNEEWVKLA